MPDTKAWYWSKTLWINVLMFLLTLAQSDLLIGMNLDPKIIASIVAVVNIVLRFLTTTALTPTK
jgi:uncharacterized membrane protein